MKKDNFYKILELLYESIKIIDAENGQSLELVNALHVYRLVEEVIPKLLKGYDLEQGWVVSDTNKVQVNRLITALKKVQTFPRPHWKDINRKTFSELGQFLEFVESIQYKRTIKRKYSDIVLVDESSRGWTLNKEDHAEMFVKAYLDYRYKKQREQSPSDQEQDAITQLWSAYQDDALELKALDIKADVSSQLKKAGMLAIVAAKIVIRKNDQRSSQFDEMIADKANLLNVLGGDQNIIRIFYKPFLETKETLAYYAVFFIQSVFYLDENSFIKRISTRLGEYIAQTFELSVNIHIQNLNPVLGKNLMPEPQKRDFLLVDGIEESWEFVEQTLLEFSYQLEKFGRFRVDSLNQVMEPYVSVVINKVRAIELKAGTFLIEPELTYFHANQIQEHIPHLLFFSTGQRSKYIWDMMHLSNHAREYIARIAVIYQENFAVWKMQKYLELAMFIEIFMMTMKESAPNAFYSFASSVRETLNRGIENRISRQLLQFAVIFRNQYQLNLLQQKLETRIISRTLKYFFHIYAEQLRSQGSSTVVLESILAANLNERDIQKSLDELLVQYRFNQPLFFKPEVRQKPAKILGEKKRIRLYAQIVEPSSIQSIISPIHLPKNSAASRLLATRLSVQQQKNQPIQTLGQNDNVPYKLIHIQRHITRLGRVEKILKQAMKTDVVIIRCLFYCDVNKAMDYAYFSKIFSTMLQDNKKRKPISDMAAYLGYWEGRKRTSQNQITDYAANVVLMFKSQALLEYPDLFAQLERNWRSACQKVERDCDPEIRIQGRVDKLQIAQTLPELQCHQLLVETTQKTLAKNIVNYLASYMVYQDLLDDEIYQQLPKWLIKKTTTTNKPKAKKSVMKKL
ncbi:MULTISPECIES: hypothetical protein [unclassified Acinetobacter]|uniref:hypothetical protein n=1 Tax=unclassified Acinetobacter TaxID=196816 RepID=UPI00244797F5|nr:MULTISPECIES: hypothetical protein [unclassified Acinetobacter]MDH0032980.1 hypothetical protein [Acinetobacter sp. GD04021]MDH0888340.1 hypothetical protein [Acinetobacter sp. GD03873]MDH1084586.1 hypothetical protein [Acinetobacter sp. GD03983]MDH2191511.1 hypothetical protein [Acinetobacter sp. GD03645]MDH2205270.1 hypothetical protein [Acinetobacter sp. GD03647]